MDEKKLLELYEKLKQNHGLKRTYDEFSISMADENYRSKIFNFVKGKSTSEEQAMVTIAVLLLKSKRFTVSILDNSIF